MINEKWFSVLKCTNNLEDTSIRIDDCSVYSDELIGYYIVLSYNDLNTAKLLLIEEFPKYKDKFTEDFRNPKNTAPIIQDIQIVCDRFTEKFIEYFGSITNLVTGLRGIEVEEDNVTPKESEEDKELLGWVDNDYSPSEEEVTVVEVDEIPKEINDDITFKDKETIKDLERQLDDLEELRYKEKKELEDKIVELNNQLLLTSNSSKIEEENSNLKSQILDLENLCKELKEKNSELEKAFPDSGLITEEVCTSFIDIVKNNNGDIAKDAILVTFNRYASDRDEVSIKKLIRDLMISYKELGGL